MKTFGKWMVLISTSVLLMAAACSGSEPSSTLSSTPETTATATGGGNVAVTLKQWAVLPTASTLGAGSITFTVTNKGSIKHEFVVLRTDTPADEIPIGSFEGEAGRIDEDTAGTNVGETGDMAPGASKAVTIDLAPGHYVFLCNLPEHFGSGMHTDVTVS